MAKTEDAQPPILFEGQKFVGARVQRLAKPEPPVAYTQLTATIPFASVLDDDRPSIFGNVFFFAPGAGDGQLERHVTMVSLFNAAYEYRPNVVVVRIAHGDCVVEAEKPLSMVTSVEVIDSASGQSPDVYRGRIPRRDDALILRLVFSDGEILPLTYATEVPGSPVGSRADLEVKRAEILDTIARLRRLHRQLPTRRATGRGLATKGEKLGPSFVFAWTDQEPSATTWYQRAERRRLWWSLIFVAGILLAGSAIGGAIGFIVSALYFSALGLILGALATWSLRADHEPIPQPVKREVYIDRVSDDFHFVLEVDGKMHLWGHWSDVQQFEVLPYWPMYGDGSPPTFQSSWHAIVMDPGQGKPWLIASTMEGMAILRERRAALDARFGVAARTAFFTALDAMRPDEKTPEFSPASGGIAPVRDRGSAPETL